MICSVILGKLKGHFERKFAKLSICFCLQNMTEQEHDSHHRLSLIVRCPAGTSVRIKMKIYLQCLARNGHILAETRKEFEQRMIKTVKK